MYTPSGFTTPVKTVPITQSRIDGLLAKITYTGFTPKGGYVHAPDDPDIELILNPTSGLSDGSITG